MDDGMRQDDERQTDSALRGNVRSCKYIAACVIWREKPLAACHKARRAAAIPAAQEQAGGPR